MKNSIKFCIGLLSCIIVSACSGGKYDGYSYNKKYKYYYKLLAFFDTYQKAHSGDVVTANIAFGNVDSDSALFQAEYEVEVGKREKTDLSLLLLEVHSGDSLSFIVDKENFCYDGLFPQEFDSLKNFPELRMNVLVSAVLDSAAYYDYRQELALQQQAKREYEDFLIQQYLKSHKEKFVHLRSDIYKCVLKQGTGKSPEMGNQVTVLLQGYLLNDEKISEATKIDFVFGNKMQVIDGIELTLKTMKCGERARVVLRSDYAWGEYGTSDGSVAPYTPVVFDVELQKVSE